MRAHLYVVVLEGADGGVDEERAVAELRDLLRRERLLRQLLQLLVRQYHLLLLLLLQRALQLYVADDGRVEQLLRRDSCHLLLVQLDQLLLLLFGRGVGGLRQLDALTEVLRQRERLHVLVVLQELKIPHKQLLNSRGHMLETGFIINFT